MQIYLPIAELPISVLMVLGLSGAVGFISGLFGVGGGFLLTPLLIFLDIPPAVAVALAIAEPMEVAVAMALPPMPPGPEPELPAFPPFAVAVDATVPVPVDRAIAMAVAAPPSSPKPSPPVVIDPPLPPVAFAVAVVADQIPAATVGDDAPRFDGADGVGVAAGGTVRELYSVPRIDGGQQGSEYVLGAAQAGQHGGGGDRHCGVDRVDVDACGAQLEQCALRGSDELG